MREYASLEGRSALMQRAGPACAVDASVPAWLGRKRQIVNRRARPSPCRAFASSTLTQGLAGPYCAMLLAQYGADVVKVEPPEGDWSRTLGKSYGDRTPAFSTCNRGKRDIVVNLKEPAASRSCWRWQRAPT